MTTNSDLLAKYGKVRRALGCMSMPHLRELRLGPKQVVAVRIIGKQGRCTMAEIARGTNSDKAAVTRIIQSLVDAGWIKRVENKKDKRQSLVRLSQKGAKNFERIEKTYKAIADRFGSALSATEREQLIQLLSKIENSLQEF
jgi:DNA-binding MarR family transcriptional regulator